MICQIETTGKTTELQVKIKLDAPSNNWLELEAFKSVHNQVLPGNVTASLFYAK